MLEYGTLRADGSDYWPEPGDNDAWTPGSVDSANLTSGPATVGARLVTVPTALLATLFTMLAIPSKRLPKKLFEALS
jgi:hypothetical protein